MSLRTRPEVLSLRVTQAERVMVVLVAQAEGMPVSELLHRLVVPATRDRFAHHLGWQEQRAPTVAGIGSEQ